MNPDDPTAEFPQIEPPKIVDLRSTAIPSSGLEWSGANRKEEKREFMNRNEEVKEGEMEEEPEDYKIERKYLNKKKRTSKLKKTLVF